jgi:hypothetical protein
LVRVVVIHRGEIVEEESDHEVEGVAVRIFHCITLITEDRKKKEKEKSGLQGCDWFDEILPITWIRSILISSEVEEDRKTVGSADSHQTKFFAIQKKTSRGNHPWVAIRKSLIHCHVGSVELESSLSHGDLVQGRCFDDLRIHLTGFS